MLIHKKDNEENFSLCKTHAKQQLFKFLEFIIKHALTCINKISPNKNTIMSLDKHFQQHYQPESVLLLVLDQCCQNSDFSVVFCASIHPCYILELKWNSFRYILDYLMA